MALLALAPLLGACEVKFTMPAYQPVTTQEYQGAVAVSDFDYRPKEGVKPNEIRETAAGTVLMTENVGSYYSNAVRRELRQSGLSLAGGKCALTGTVHDFAIESLGFSATYISDVEYRLQTPGGEQTGRYQVKFETSKFLDPSLIVANVQKTVSDNIGQMLADPAFKAALGRCR
ncbi:MAG: hypothetical protein KIT25_08950 [Enhydrobacter sp.]|nr:MAG: hypothetical protein KIT25_08950 [Enhydrobacter sp.]